MTVEEADALAEVDRGRRLRSPSHRPQPLEEAGARAGHVARVQVVILHEPLGRQGAVGAVSHRDRDRFLILETEPVRLPTGASVKAITHAPEKLLGGRDVLRLARDEHTEPHELAPGAELQIGVAMGDPVARPRRPACSVEVAKAARAALDVRLEQIHRAAEALVARRGLGVEAVDEPPERLFAEETFVGPRDDLAERRLVAREHAQVEQRRRGREVRLSERHRVGHAEHLVPHRQRRVPQGIEERLCERGRVSTVDSRRVDDEDDVGVAAERHGAAAEAAHGCERQAAALGGVDPRQARRLGEARIEARLEKPSVRPAEGEPVLTGGQAFAEDGAMPVDRITQQAGFGRGDGQRRRRRTGIVGHRVAARALENKAKDVLARLKSLFPNMPILI